MIAEYRDHSPGYFDLVITDECHRSIYGKWSGVLRHFDGIQLGLTATPCTVDDADLPDPEDGEFVRDTLRFFGLDAPTFRYTLREAIDAGHLVPYRIYKAMTVKTASNGGFEVGRDELDWSAMDQATRDEFDELFEHSDRIAVDPRALERKFTIPERNRAMVREFRDCFEKGFMGKDGVRRTPAMGKTIVFAVTRRHAETLAAMFDERFADLKPDPATRFADFVVSDVGGGPAPDAAALIKRFKEEPFPQILVSVNMLDTGFDCPEVVNLVMARFTRSAILYRQMRGRGDGKTLRRGLGDGLGRAAVRRLHEATFFGADVDPQMVRLATMNLTLRGLDRVRILRRDALTRSLDRAAKAEFGLPPNGFDAILANPPFSGRLDRDRIVEDVKVGRTAQTELLFLQYMLNHLKEGGRCGVVVPEGVLFGSTGAHRELRRKLVENNTVGAVLSLPGGVFNPYSGVKTSVLVFGKGGTTARVMFLNADNDGFKLDANHDQPIDEDDLPGLVDAYRDRGAREAQWRERDPEAEWTEKWWFAETEAIRDADFNLSAGRHRPQAVAAVEHRDPLVILEELRGIETEILGEIDALATAVSEATRE